MTSTLSNDRGEPGPVQRPDQAALGEFRLEPLEKGCLGRPVEHRRRVVERQQIGAFEYRCGNRELLPLGLGETRAAGADRIVEPDLDQRPAQPELVEHFGNGGVDSLAAARFAAHESAEQHIFLHRGGGIVTLGVEELDRAAQLLGQFFGKDPPRFQDSLLDLFVDQIERVASRNQAKRQREKPFARRLKQRFDPGPSIRFRMPSKIGSSSALMKPNSSKIRVRAVGR